ncbi:MAG TPA: hypothetical protein VGM98_18115 [Schlesneria sp.]|jgi:flagellar biosynthesis/type III secretory pathway protein FliH
MNGLIPSIISFPGPPPVVTYLRTDQLDKYCDAEAILAAAQREANTLKIEANKILDDARRDALNIHEKALRDGLASATDELERQRVALVGETIQWLIDEQALEASIADRLDARISALVVDIVSRYLGDQDSVELLTRRIRTVIPEESIAHRIRLRVSPANAAPIQDRLSTERRIFVVADDAISDTEAKLETPDAIVCLDLERDLKLLLSSLTTCPSGILTI